MSFSRLGWSNLGRQQLPLVANWVYPHLPQLVAALLHVGALELRCVWIQTLERPNDDSSSFRWSGQDFMSQGLEK